MKRIGILIVLGFFAVSTVDAQEPLQTLASVVRRVATSDPGILAQQSAVEAARAGAHEAETQRYPKLFVSMNAGEGKSVNDLANVLLTGLQGATVASSSTRSRLADLSNSRPYFVPGARLEENLYDGGLIRATIQSARLTEDKTVLGKQRTVEAESSRTASYFLDLARGQTLEKDLGNYLSAAQLAAKAVADQAQAGRATEAQALAMQAKARAAEAAVENNRADMRLWSKLLRELASLPASATFDTRPIEKYLEAFQVTPIPTEPDLDQNIALKEAGLDTRIQEQALRKAESRRLPQIQLVAQYGFQFSNLLFTFRPGYNAGIEVTYPLFTSGETKSKIVREQRSLQAATLRKRKAQQTLSGEYAKVQEENGKIARNLDAARAQLAQAVEVYRVARLKYDQGAGSPSDLLDAAGLLLTSRERCLDLARSSLLLYWSVLQSRGGLEADLEKGALP